jgi:hypothetical protein
MVGLVAMLLSGNLQLNMENKKVKLVVQQSNDLLQMLAMLHKQ